jgi:glycosyltransferase involved in cell wall biosynthesis
MREKLAYADNVITCCEFNRDYILDHFGGTDARLADKLHVCHHGLDLATFPFQPGERRPRHVIAVGRLSAHKGFDYVLRATQLLHQQGVELTVEIVGDGEERKSLEAHAARCGISHLVQFSGWLPFAEARAAMSRASVLVHASPGLGDGLPNVIREAMALGTPVIATSVAGIPEALSADCGVLVPARDVQALAAAMEGLLGDGGLRQFIAERARRRVEERYDMWRNGEVLANLLSTTRRGVNRMKTLHDASAAVA